MTRCERAAAARAALAACILAVVAACDGGGQPAPATSTPTATVQASATGQPTTGSCPAPAVDQADAASVLVPSPVNGVPQPDVQGERLVIAAVVLDAQCRPAAGASLRIWHTDARGRYGPPGTEDCCYYGGTVRSDDAGRFRLETIRPGQYPEPGAPLAHIHLEVEHATGRLETEIVFPEGSSAPAAGAGGRVVPVTLRSVDPADADPYWYGEAALVLGR